MPESVRALPSPPFMAADLEIIIPARNPTDLFAKTIDSLLAQTDRNFRVLISDNHSVHGGEHIENAMEQLRGAGIPVEKVRPPEELQRVEHWNWLHFRSTAEWVKPLFAGDWLAPEYVSTVCGEIAREPRCLYVYTAYELHTAGHTAEQVCSAWSSGHYRSPLEWQNVVLRYAMQFGPPSVAVYRRDAFIASGGYRTSLPICADSLFFCAMAARFGATGFGKFLSHFNLHGARFSTDLPARQAAIFTEVITYITLLVYHAWTENISLPWWGVVRLYARQSRTRVRQLLGSLAS